MRRGAALALAGVALVGLAGPARAAPRPDVPPDVRAAFGAESLRQVQQGGDGVHGDFSGDIRADSIHEVFRFSTEFVDGTATAEPVVRTDTWVAAIIRGDDVLGTMLVWRPDGGTAELAGYASDAANGTALSSLTAGELLVADEPIGAFFALDGTTVRPLNERARDELPEPAHIDDLQETVAERYGVMRDQAADVDGDPGLPVAVLLTTTLGLFAVAFAVRRWLQRRRSRAAEQVSGR